MFKKAPDVKASAAIKSSEKRKLLETVCKLYGLPKSELSKEEELKLIPSSTKQATFKSILGFNGTIYVDENETPIWFKTRDSQIFPSLFTLWKCPYLLPIVKTHRHVISKLSGGAQLMLPGTIPPFDSRAVKGAIVAIACNENPNVALAIGECNMDLSNITRVVGTQGVAVDTIHAFEDGLYQLNKLVDIDVPAELNVDVPWSEGVKNDEHDGDEHNGDEHDEHTEDTKIKDVHDDQSNVNVQEVAEVLESLSVEDVDNFFVRSFFQSIQKNDIETPITSSNFMANYILKNLPAVSPEICNIKKTSWKKSAKFLKAMEKQKYLTTKTQGKDDLVVTWLIPKTHEKIVNFVPHKTIASVSGAPKKIEPSNRRDRSQELSVIQLYKPTKNYKEFFTKIEMESDALYTGAEINSMVNTYASKFKLADEKNRKNIIPDEVLCSLLKIDHKSCSRAEIIKKFTNACSPRYIILKPGEEIPNTEDRFKKGTPPKINIISETKIGRKIVTRVSNFEVFHIKPHNLADELKVKCSGSATVAPMIQNPQIIEVTVQGPHGKLITDHLISKGIPLEFITFEDKVKRKKKKV